MDYVIDMLEENKKYLERHIKKVGLMQTDMRKATKELHRVTELKKAIKILKQKQRK
jgi:hypothetical protein